MDIQTFEEATRLHGRYKLCEEVMEYLSEDHNTKSPKYLHALGKFVDEFRVEFMTLVHEQMTAAGMAFEDLHCCPAENPNTPEP